MRKVFLLSLFSIVVNTLFAQVPKVNIVEHFTNTNCSICGSNNPGIYSAINNFPQTLHIAVHPSSPYASCYFSVQNPVENDGRTNFYGIYGSTPKVILNGLLIPYSNLNSLLSVLQTDSSHFSMTITQQWVSTDSVMVMVNIKKVAPDTLTQVFLFATAAQDTVQKLTGNGESLHHDVLRKALTSTGGNLIILPVAVNDSVSQTFGYKIGVGWNASVMKVTALIQYVSNKQVIQAGRSSNILSPTVVTSSLKESELCYPNPTNHSLFITNWQRFNKAVVYSMVGQEIWKEDIRSNKLDVSKLPNGHYILSLQPMDTKTTNAIIHFQKN